MGEFHRTYSKVWWPNLDLEDSLSPSSSPSSSNGSHRSQDSGFSDSSSSKQSAEQHLRNFAHTPENQMHSSPEPCGNIEEETEDSEHIILPESQYAETPIRVRKPATKSNTQDVDTRLTPDTMSNSFSQHDISRSKRGQSTRSPDYSELPLDPRYKSTSLIESEKLNYQRKKDHRKSMGFMRSNTKSSVVENNKKNRHSLSLNLVSHQNEENVNPRLYQSYSEEQPYQRPSSESPQNKSNEVFKETYNFQPYKSDVNQNKSIPRVIGIKSKIPNYIDVIKTNSSVFIQPISPGRSYNNFESPPSTVSPLRVYSARVDNNTTATPAVQNAQKESTTVSPIHSPCDKSIFTENRSQSTSERNSVLLQRLKPAERQLLENLTANYFSKSTSLDKDESIYINLEKNLDSKIIHDKVQKLGSTSLQHPHENRNSVSLNITSTAFNETITPLNHTVDSHNYNSAEIFEPRNNLQRYHTYSQICDQDSSCFIKKWENSMADSSANQSNIPDNSSIHESRCDMSQCTNQLTQESTYSGYSSNLTEASYYLPGYLSYVSADSPALQSNFTNDIGHVSDLSPVVNDSKKSNTNNAECLVKSVTSPLYNANSNLFEIADQSFLDVSMLSESINSVLSRHRSKSNEILDKSKDLICQNSSLDQSYTENQVNQKKLPQNQRHQNREENLDKKDSETKCERLKSSPKSVSSSHLNSNEFSKHRIRRRSKNESNAECGKRSRSLVRVNRHSTSFENYDQEDPNHIRRCKSLSNLEQNQPTPSKVEPMKEPIFCGGKSFLQSNLDLIEPPHFTSTPKKVQKPHELQRRRPLPPPVIAASTKEDANVSR